ncbi:MAG: hypothetical protein Q7R97_01390 [Candidatus Daviesbacteria bacterium]|nr:hypothetical protein [Candidatus Daviesbacteria bacterium]
MASHLSSFYDCPPKIRLVHQEEDEHIELFLRQHWITNISWLATAFLGILLPILLISLKSFIQSVVSFSIPIDLYLAGIILWYMFILAYIIESFLHWYFNIYIVTNRHLVDINFWNLLYRDITEVRIADVESARTHIRGVLGPLFNYGDVVIETAAERQNIQFFKVPNPDIVAERVQDLQENTIGTGGNE